MAKWSISIRQRAWLAEQLDLWQSEQLVSADQASRVLGLYETAAELAERGRSKLLLALMGIAAFLIGLALLLLVGYNWHAIPAGLKLLIIFATLVATQGMGLLLRFRRQARLLSEVVFCLGGMFYGSAIFLVAQIFNLNGHYPDAVWWWALGVLPFALCLESVLLHSLLAALLAIWCGMEILGFADLGGWFWGRWSFLPNGAYTLPLLVLPGFLWAYRRGSTAAVWIYVLLVTWWIVIQPVAWRVEELSPIFIGAVAGLMLILAECHPRNSRFAVPYRECGTLLMAGALLVLSFHSANKEIFEFAGRDHGADGLPGLIMGSAGGWALLATTLIASVLVLYLASKLQVEAAPTTQNASLQLESPLAHMLQAARRQWLPVGLVSLMIFLFAWWILHAGSLLPTILANIAMIVLGFWMIGEGLRRESGRAFAAGVVYLLVGAVMRYIDLFGDFGGMLGAAALFLGSGLALFAVAWFWQHRKEGQRV